MLRQAYAEKVQPCLVLNKIDRLICELQLTPEEAYKRLKRVLEEVRLKWNILFVFAIVNW